MKSNAGGTDSGGWLGPPVLAGVDCNVDNLKFEVQLN